jgi:lipopolysaccharide transport system permease protein
MDSFATASARITSRPTTIIEPKNGLVADALRELWRRRELVFFLTWRDIKVRSKQTAIGFLWAILQPAMTMLIFSIVFGRLAQVPSEGVPYSVFAMCGIVPWLFFSTSLSQSSNSLVSNAPLLSKIYLPRLSLPLASVCSTTLDFGLAFCLMLVLMISRGIYPNPQAILVLPFLFLALFCIALGAGLWLSALNVKYRDIRYAVPFLIQVWMFSTSIAYPSSLVPEKWRPFYELNPMVGVVDGFRLALLGIGGFSPYKYGVVVIAAGVLLVTGCLYFLKLEQQFADVI